MLVLDKILIYSHSSALSPDVVFYPIILTKTCLVIIDINQAISTDFNKVDIQYYDFMRLNLNILSCLGRFFPYSVIVAE